MGDEVQDPQTGQSLGRMEEPCCVVEINHVRETMSYGTLRNVAVYLNQALPGGLQLRGEAVATRGAEVAESTVGRDSHSSATALRQQPVARQAAPGPGRIGPKADGDKRW